MSKKTGRGELKSDWKDTSQPIMCCYKLVECEFKWIGLQSTVESRIQKVSLSSCSLAHLLPACASEQGNVIGSVRIYNIYIYVCVQKKIVIERTRDLIYLKVVATDFFPKIISPSAGENSGDLA